MSFYVSLPSNSSADYFPANKSSHYTTKLKIPIKLDQPYEVGLVEIIFNSSWSSNLGSIFYHDENINIKFEIWAFEGEEIGSIIKSINAQLQQTSINAYRMVLESNLSESNLSESKISEIDTEKLVAEYSKNVPNFVYEKNKIKLKCRDNSFVRLEGLIKHILGFNQEEIVSSDEETSITSFKLQTTQSIFIYTDIIDFQYVGDSLAPLLRNSAVPNDYFKTICLNYESPHYISVNKSEINTINISIRDDLGQFIRFEDKVLIKLHFRPLKYGF